MDAPIEIRVYAGNDAEFELYEDENDTYNYEKGKYTIIKFNWDEKSKSLKIAKRVGEFKGMQKNRVFKVVVLDGKKKLIKTVKYNGNLKVIKIKANL
jgi:alpha-D-xyloside xylohydrolase